jgi:phenylalanyl-tRNA synthetase beta chain
MRFSHSWLAEFVEVSERSGQLAEMLTAAGLETYAEEEGAELDPRIVTARVVRKGPHPNADQLSLCQVDDGSGSLRDVVCGATNFSEGDAVVLAVPGSRLPGVGKLKKSKIRGVVSQGMLCSETELEIGTDHSGIIVLPAETEPGQAAQDLLVEREAYYEIEAYANRPDWLGVAGVAREVSAVSGAGLAEALQPDDGFFDVPSTASEGVAGQEGSQVRVRIDAPDACWRYIGAVMTNVRVGPSDPVMAKRLEAAGVRAINNVVDCTNYVLLELGQPVHAFDRRLLRGDAVVIRKAAEGESLVTLDGVERTLTVEDLLICDAEGGQALAGVMGGEHSEVRDDSQELFLEVACFDPDSVRATSRRVGLSTESSQRFARGVDPSLPGRAFRRLVQLLEEHADGRLAGPVADLVPEGRSAPWVGLRRARVAQLLGKAVPDVEILGAFDRQGFRTRDEADGWSVRAPLARFDIEREVDLIEEVARLVGLDSIPSSLPSATRVGSIDGARFDRRRLRQRLAAAGFAECLTYAFISEELLTRAGLAHAVDDAIRVLNPLSRDGSVMRPSLLPSLLQVLQHNVNQGRREARLCEIRSVFLPGALTGGDAARYGGRAPRETAAGPAPANEPTHVAGVWMGGRRTESWEESSSPSVGFYDAKGLVETLAEALGCAGLRFDREGVHGSFDPLRSARVSRGKQTVGFVGRLSTAVALAFDLPSVPVAFELNLDALTSMGRRRPSYKSFSRFPAVERDLSFYLPEGADLGPVTAALERARIDDLVSVRVFDEYRGERAPAGHRSVALRLRFQNRQKTLTEEDATQRFERARQVLREVEALELREG